MRGATLIELMVVMLVLGTVAGVSALALTGLRVSPASEQRQRLLTARASAIRSGEAASVELGGGRMVRFLPDGRAIGPGVDQLTGQVLDAKP
jgi:prepilin-type N-terminal cleavage/methylation domain-containing protein